MVRRIEVVDYNPRWSQEFVEAAERILSALGDQVTAIHHIGSTAIPGIKAKPTIDILVETRNLEEVDARNPAMEQAGYQARGENGIPGRRYFVRQNGEVHTHHVHVFQTGHSEVKRHLNFRDYLRSHPNEAQAYSRLKEQLSRDFPEDGLAYTQGKNAFVAEIDRQARDWKQELLRSQT